MEKVDKQASPKEKRNRKREQTNLGGVDLLSQLVHESPRAEIKLAGVPVTCVLDTGAETSLISGSFFRKNLAQKVSGVKPVGTFLKVFGVGGLQVPVEGYVKIPLSVNVHDVAAHFLVVSDSAEGELLDRKRGSVLLGCNVLDLLKDMEIDKQGKDAKAWEVTLQWYRLTRTGKRPTVIHPRQVQTVNCQRMAPLDRFMDNTVLVEGVQSSGTGLGDSCRVYDSCMNCSSKTVSVLLANLGTRAVVVPTFTRLADVSEITSAKKIELTTDEAGVQVRSCGVCLEQNYEQECPISSLERTPELVADDPPGEVNIFMDGTRYQLPLGLSLADCNLTAEQKDQVTRLIQQHQQVFSRDEFDVGQCDRVPHKIKTIDDAPVSQPYRRIPPHCLQEVNKLLQRLLDQGIITESNSPYASPVVLVKKKNGSIRLCIDYRKLNANTVRDSFPLPRIEESLEALGGEKCFSSLDLAHGYHQVVMDSESVEKTAFRVPFGLYEYTRMPFGLVNAPGYRQCHCL